MAKLIFRNPLVLKNGTGFSVSTNNEELNALTASVVTFSIPQELSTSSSVVFNSINTSDRVNIDNGSLILTNSGITGSFTQVGNQGITSDITVTGNVTVKGILTAETITSGSRLLNAKDCIWSEIGAAKNTKSATPPALVAEEISSKLMISQTKIPTGMIISRTQ